MKHFVRPRNTKIQTMRRAQGFVRPRNRNSLEMERAQGFGGSSAPGLVECPKIEDLVESKIDRRMILTPIKAGNPGKSVVKGLKRPTPTRIFALLIR
jgi:hypothetical protein